jgi:hypothetical protein
VPKIEGTQAQSSPRFENEVTVKEGTELSIAPGCKVALRAYTIMCVCILCFFAVLGQRKRFGARFGVLSAYIYDMCMHVLK